MRVLSKSLFVLLLVGSATLNIIAILPFGLAQSGTNVSGLISSDTIWTKLGSPYIFTAPVGISANATLTIESGVTINLNSYYLQINGNLQAIGSSTDPISFQGTTIPYSSEIRFIKNNSNQPITPTSTIENAILNISLVRAYNETVKLNSNTIYCSVNLGSRYGIITRNVFYGTSNFALIAGAPVIWNNTFSCSNSAIEVGYDDYGMPMIVANTIKGTGAKDGYAIWGGSANVSDNIITNWDTGIDLAGNTEIKNNWIYNNTIGVTRQWNTNCVIQNNTIENNTIAINVPQSSTIINFNNILNNAKYSIYMHTTGNINATYNWWGTTDVNSINPTTYDNKNDFNLGKIDISPILNESNSQAMPNSNVPMTIMLLPSSYVSPTLSPTQTPILSPSLPPSETPTSTPAVPELSCLVILPLLLSVFSVAAVFRHRNQVKKP